MPCDGTWLKETLESLPAKDRISERNSAISAIYARLFLEHPDLFWWAGMAAFSSFRVGLLLALYDFSYERQRRLVPVERNRLIDDAELLTSLETLRKTNNEVYRSAGVAHLAYIAGGYSLECVRRTLHDGWEESELVRAFEVIDKGRTLLSNDHTEQGRRCLKEGNRALLKHEQWAHVQRRFSEIEYQLGLFMSLATSLDFDANHLRNDPETRTSFNRFLWTRRPWLLLVTASLPDMTHIRHRWSWIADSVLPIWERAKKDQQTIRKHLERIERRAVPFDAARYYKQRIAGIMA